MTINQTSDTFTSLNRDRALTHVMEQITRYWKDFDQARPGQPGVDEHIEEMLSVALPEQGMDSLLALQDADAVLDRSISQPRPRYFAFVGSSGLEMGVLADVLASTHDINLAVYAGAANLVEQQALRWVAELMGFPGVGGTFTSGGMLSNLTALTAAREYALPGSRKNGIRQPVAVYISRDAHSSVDRAAEILGIGSSSVRSIPLDEHRRMDVAILKQRLEEDMASGVKPVAIVASAGTTLAGAVDPIAEIAEVANAHDIWLHIDGAYGMPAAATDTAKHHFAGLERANSITIDAHKWLFLPKPCGVLLVQDRNTLRAAFTHDATYIRDETANQNPVEWTLEYSRPLRALKVWLAFRAYGAEAFRAAITRNLNQGELCASLVKDAPNMELLMEPQLSVVLYRRVPTTPDVDANAHNKALAKALQADGRVYVAGANVDGVDCLRACFVNFRTRDDDVRVLIEVTEEVGANLEAQ